MGRPKGSRNKKRQYRKRKSNSNNLKLYPAVDAGLVLDLVGEVKDRLMHAKPDIAREAIPILVEELGWLEKLIDGVPPAP